MTTARISSPPSWQGRALLLGAAVATVALYLTARTPVPPAQLLEAVQVFGQEHTTMRALAAHIGAEPDNPQAWATLAHWLARREQFNEAAGAYARWAQLEPGNVVPRRQQVRMLWLAADGQSTPPLQRLTAAARTAFPLDGPLRDMAHTLDALSLSRAGQHVAAQELWRELESTTTDPALRALAQRQLQTPGG